MSDTKPSTPEYRAISSLHNWENNPRTATKDGIERLIKQIKKLGVYKPLLITEDGTVLGGNMRLKALEQMGEKKVWVSVVQADTEEKKIEYALSDNDRVGKYEGDQLANLIGNFPEVEWGDYSVDIKEPELVSDLMDSFKEVEEDEAPAVEMGPAESKLGEVYQLGRHRVMCGDSTKIEDVTKLMDGKKADMVFTDPPYGVDYEGGSSNKTKRSDSFSDGEPIYTKWLSLRSAFAKDTCAFYIWYAEGFDGTKLVYEAVENAGLKIRSQIIWNKLKAHYGALGAQYKQKHEPMLYCVDKPPKWFGESNECSVWDVEQSHLNEFHPTQKPIALSVRAIRNSSEDNDIVNDLFLGSGSTLIACEQTNRICYGMELDPHYVDVIRKRYDNFVLKTGQKQEK